MFACILSADVDTITILQNKQKKYYKFFFYSGNGYKKKYKKITKNFIKLLTKKQKYYKMFIVPEGNEKNKYKGRWKQ